MMDYSSLEEKTKNLPDVPGVYLFKDQKGKVLYVGKAVSLKKRVLSHFRGEPAWGKTRLRNEVRDLKYIETSSELEALLKENSLIKKYQPRYNILLKDDKQYPLIKLTKDVWPRLLVARNREDDGAEYFGRFQGGTARKLLRLLRKIFPLRTCKGKVLKKRARACLDFDIQRCLGPCIGAVSQKEYKKICRQVSQFLRGNVEKILKSFRRGMEKAAQKRRFEDAAHIRDKIKAIEQVSFAREIPQDQIKDKNYALSDLKEKLGLSVLPLRIEAFDVSNIGPYDIVGSMVVFEGGFPQRADYRRFRVRRVGQDDVGAMREIVERRYTGSLRQNLKLPDLVLVDGGRGQVGAAQEALSFAGLEKPVISLAKKWEEIYFPGKKEKLRLPKSSGALYLLQQVRDEAHRFALNYHRLRRGKRVFSRKGKRNE